MKTLVKMKFGSHLYGLDTPQSDLDYVGVYLSPISDIILKKDKPQIVISQGDPSEKNKPGDIDYTAYSLHTFLNLALTGQTLALDMLHAPTNMILKASPEWDFLVKHRAKFYTKNLNAFTGYARQQAAKYGIKGSRLSDAKRFLEFLKSLPIELDGIAIRLHDYWGGIPEGEFIKEVTSGKPHIRSIQVCGITLQETAKIPYLIDIMEGFCNKYGHRAKLAESNEGLDWKAISHALRAALEVREILLHQTITFPLKDREYLKRVKAGTLDYLQEVAPVLESLMEELEILTQNSKLPATVDHRFWDAFILRVYRKEYEKELP